MRFHPPLFTRLTSIQLLKLSFLWNFLRMNRDIDWQHMSLETKNAKEKKYCATEDISQKNAPFYLKRRKPFPTTSLIQWSRGKRLHLFIFVLFVKNVYVFWFVYFTRPFSCFLLISLLTSSTLFTTKNTSFLHNRATFSIKERCAIHIYQCRDGWLFERI